MSMYIKVRLEREIVFAFNLLTVFGSLYIRVNDLIPF